MDAFGGAFCTSSGTADKWNIEGDLASQQQRRTCLQCKRSKVKCDRASPCSRCVRLNLECRPNPRPPGRPQTLTTPLFQSFMVGPGTNEGSSNDGLKLLSGISSTGFAGGAEGLSRGNSHSTGPGRPRLQQSSSFSSSSGEGPESGGERYHPLSSGDVDAFTALVAHRLTSHDIALEKARSILLSWHIWNTRRQADCTLGRLGALQGLLGFKAPQNLVPPALPDIGGSGPMPGGGSMSAAAKEAELLDAFADRCAKDDTWATCTVTWRAGDLHRVWLNERFNAIYIPHHELDLALRTAPTRPEFLSERFVTPEFTSTFREAFVEACFSVETKASECYKVLKVYDRFALESVCLACVRSFCSPCGWFSGISISMLPLPFSRAMWAVAEMSTPPTQTEEQRAPTSPQKAPVHDTSPHYGGHLSRLSAALGSQSSSAGGLGGSFRSESGHYAGPSKSSAQDMDQIAL